MVLRKTVKSAMAAFMAASLVFLAMPENARAQQQGVQRIPVSELLDRLDRLERDVTGLRGSRAGFGSDGLARLDQIESELRRLTGSVERLEYEAARNAERVEKSALDFETRLQALERRVPLSPSNDPVAMLPQQPAPAPVLAPQQVITQLPRPGGASVGPAFSFGGGSPAPAIADTAPDLSAIPGAPVPMPQPLSIAPQPALTQVLPTTPTSPSFALDPVLPTGSTAVTPLGVVPQQPQSIGLSPSSPSALYDEGVRLLNLGLFDDAGATFEQLAQQYPDDPATGQAKFWLGDMHLRLGRFEIAAKSFLESFKGWPNGPKAPDSLLKLGITLANLGQREEACLTFTQFGPRYPQAGETLLRRAELEARRAQCGG